MKSKSLTNKYNRASRSDSNNDKEQNIIAIIPARGCSKGIPKKNIKPLKGKPLIYYTIEESKKSKYLNHIVVSTEDDVIAKIAKQCHVDVVYRQKQLARDNTPSIYVFQQVIKHLEKIEEFHPNTVVILQPTSPLRTVEDIDRALKKFLESSCDSIVSICEVEKPPHWMYTLEGDRLVPFIKNGKKPTRRQDAPKIYRLNGAIYITRRDVIMKEKTLLGRDTRAYIMPLERSVDIDTELDFKLAELLIDERNSTKP